MLMIAANNTFFMRKNKKLENKRKKLMGTSVLKKQQ